MERVTSFVFNTARLLLYLLIEELRHQFQRFFCLRQLEVIPESVREGFEDDQLRVVSGLQQRAMKNCGAAEQDVAAAGD